MANNRKANPPRAQGPAPEKRGINPARAILLTLGIVAVVVVVVALAVSNSNQRRESRPTPPRVIVAPQTSGGQAILVCQDCAEIGMNINLWTEPGDLASGARVGGSAPHNTKATILDQAAGWYKVKASNGATGWLQAEFVKR